MKNIFSKLAQPFLKIVCLGLIINTVSKKANCQLLTNDNVTVTILAATQVTVQGDVLNQNASDISNNGTIDLSGNWFHNAVNNCFGTSAGTVILNGANQVIGGSSSTLFNNLILLGSGSKTLLTNIFVGGSAATGALNIGSRNLVLNTKIVSVINPSTAAISFTTGFITSEQTNNSSKVIWSINSTLGTHTIPFGNAAGDQIPFTYNLTSGNAGDVIVSTYPTPANNLPLPVTPIAVTHIRNNAGVDNSANTVNRFWEVDNSGTPTAALTFTWASTENAANGNLNPIAQRWIAPSVAWQTPITGQTNPTAQSVTVPNVTYNSFGPWSVALAATPLPIELLSFTATAIDNKKVDCKWATASEINNDCFTIERSKNAIDFERIGVINGAGTINVINNYNFMDEDPYTGVSYYRLKQTDINGAYTFSQTVAVRMNITKEIKVYPTLTNGDVFIDTDKGLKNAVIKITSLSGVLLKQINGCDDDNSVNINLNELAAGTYFITIEIENKTEVFKLVKI